MQHANRFELIVAAEGFTRWNTNNFKVSSLKDYSAECSTLLQDRTSLRRENKKATSVQKYFVLTENELISLIVCITLDISEYLVALLLLPVVGDLLDFVGIFACLVMFRWVGAVSLVELIPGADVLPIFIITWLLWYFLKRRK